MYKHKQKPIQLTITVDEKLAVLIDLLWNKLSLRTTTCCEETFEHLKFGKDKEDIFGWSRMKFYDETVLKDFLKIVEGSKIPRESWKVYRDRFAFLPEIIPELEQIVEDEVNNPKYCLKTLKRWPILDIQE